MPFPMAAAAIPAIGSFISSLFGASSQRKQQRDSEKFARETQQGNIASNEASLDPWRNVMAQVGHASTLDKFANANYSPVRMQNGRPTGGTAYSKSPELLAAAKAAAAMILSGGGQAPSMTNTANYGKTGTTDLLQVDPLTGRPRQAQAGRVVNPWTVDKADELNLYGGV